MKTKAVGIQTLIDTNALKVQLEELGYGKDLVDKMVNFAEAETGKKEQNMNSNPVPTDNMNPVPTVMKPISHLNKALEYSAVWAEPGKQLGPNADIPSLAEAADEGIETEDEENDDERDETEDNDNGVEVEEEDEGEEDEDIVVSPEEAQQLGEEIGINWEEVKFTPEALAEGIVHELEHGSKDKETNITDDDPVITAKIAWAHLKEDPEYYTKLNKMEDAEEGENGAEENGIEEENEVGGPAPDAKPPVKRFEAMLRQSAATIRELQQNIIPRLEDQLFQAEAALQSLPSEDNIVIDARDAIHEAQASLSQIKEKVFSLGDVDPVTYGGPEEPKQKGLLDKLFKS